MSEEDIHMDWYILKVQSNREDRFARRLSGKMKIAGLERYFDEVIVPTEKVTEFKGGKKKVVERKLYPGYIVVHMEINDDTWFLVRETSGHRRLHRRRRQADADAARTKWPRIVSDRGRRNRRSAEARTSSSPTGDRVKINEGNFENFEGEVDTIDEASGRVTVMINIFGRSTPVELEYWQIEAV